MQVANDGCTYHRCGATAIIFMLKSKLRSLNIEDNFNNTFFGKVLPHTTAVVTEFEAKVILFPDTAKQNRTLFYKTNPPCLHANLFLTQRKGWRWRRRWRWRWQCRPQMTPIGRDYHRFSYYINGLNEMKHEWPYDEFWDETEGAATHACLAEWQCVCAPASQDLHFEFKLFVKICGRKTKTMTMTMTKTLAHFVPLRQGEWGL